MKRKILSLALIAALVFTLSVSAFAADVASGGSGDVVDKEIEAIVSSKTEASEGTVDKAVDKVTEIVEEFLDKDFYTKNTEAAEKVDELIAKAAEAAGKTVEKATVGLVDAFEFAPSDEMRAKVANGEAVEVTFTGVKDIKATDTVVVMHQKADGTWEVLDAYVAADGTVVAKFTGFSPVTISVLAVEYGNATTPTTPSTPSTDTTVRSPQTSDIG